jgi:hypothetical protein
MPLAPPIQPENFKSTLPCLHRGVALEVVASQLDCCRGERVTIFACGLHADLGNRCVLDSYLPFPQSHGMAICRNCAHRS